MLAVLVMFDITVPSDCFSDYRVRRRLEFRAVYNVDCSLLSHPITRTTLMSMIQQQYDQIDSICLKGTTLTLYF